MILLLTKFYFYLRIKICDIWKLTFRKFNNILTQFLFPFICLASFLWVLIRVLPKPSRLRYPCIKVASPFATGFLLHILTLLGSTIVLTNAKRNLKKSRYFVALFLFGLTAGGLLINSLIPERFGFANRINESSNSPLGDAKGIFPGRVVWVWDPDATSESCSNSTDDYWWMDKNNNLTVIDEMFSNGLRQVSGKQNTTESWDALFRHFNNSHGKGNVGYRTGEKIAIKINLANEWDRHYNDDYEWQDDGLESLKHIDSTPQLVLVILRQLINLAGIPEEDILIGDPIRNFTGPYWDLCSHEFPNVNYWARDGGNGRTMIVPSESPVLFYSDGQDNDHLPQSLIQAEYLINMPVLKAHSLAGISLAAKNHFGSHCRESAAHLHGTLPSTAPAMNQYRSLVDMMGHEHLGGKTLLILVDGLWGAGDATYPPNKWHSTPFNNDWPSSLFLSMDPVAVESVCYDFLADEYDAEHYGDENNPHMPGTQDYLHQAASPLNWPVNFTYDPENDGIPLESFGVHEHWNNAQDKRYSRDLGFDDGIELVKYLDGIIINSDFITVTSPNGGEVWESGSNQDIRWTSSGTSGIVRIDYSTDGGDSWNSVGNSTPDDGYYSWAVPAIPTNTCLVKVSDSDGVPNDQSDGVFSIFAPQPVFITVTSPNGGEVWESQNYYDIAWTSSGTSGLVTIDYSTDVGGTWNSVVNSTTDDGLYSWTVPATPSNTCLVKVVDAVHTHDSLADISDSVFRITFSPTISGVVSNEFTKFAGVAITSDVGDVVYTNEYGEYSFEVPFMWNGNLRPALEGYAFSPSSRTYANITFDKPDQDYECYYIGTSLNSNETLPSSFQLYQNYPNPFNNHTVISYSIPKSCHAKLNIFSVSGELIRTIIYNSLKPGSYLVRWAGKDNFGLNVSSGIYICKLSTDHFEKSIRMLYLK